MRIEKPGPFVATMDQYLADPCPEPSLSAGLAHKMIVSTPAHVWTNCPRLNPDYEGRNANIFDIGSAFHTMLTGVGDPIALVDANDWRGKDAKAQRDELRAAGKLPLLTKDYERVENMVDATRHQLAATEIGDPFDHEPRTCEVNIAWQSRGIWNRCRADKLDPERRIIFDVKTTTSVAEDDFVRRIRGLGYDMIRVHYLEGVGSALGPGWRHIFVVVETAPPHGLRLVELPGEWDGQAGEKLARAAEKWRWCLDNRKWPAYPAEVMRPAMPDWHENAWVRDRDRERHTSETTGRDALGAAIDYSRLWAAG